MVNASVIAIYQNSDTSKVKPKRQGRYINLVSLSDTPSTPLPASPRIQGEVPEGERGFALWDKTLIFQYFHLNFTPIGIALPLPTYLYDDLSDRTYTQKCCQNLLQLVTG